jgi:hypothetical protein
MKRRRIARLDLCLRLDFAFFLGPTMTWRWVDTDWMTVPLDGRTRRAGASLAKWRAGLYGQVIPSLRAHAVGMRLRKCPAFVAQIHYAGECWRSYLA